jgi:NDP-sugar pyrophosphorylase family protein
MNADVIHLAPLKLLSERHLELRRSRGVVMTLVLASGAILQDQDGFYREIFSNDETGLIEGFGEKKQKVPFFTGTAVFEPEAFMHLGLGRPSEFVPDVLEPAIRAGKVGFLHSDALWLDIGSPELWYQAEKRMRSELAAGTLPRGWIERLNHSDPTLQGRFELGKNQIRLDDTVYEIKDLRNS